MENNSNDDLLKAIEDLSSRLALVEEAVSKVEPKEQDEKEVETPTETESDTSEVESEDEIEKLLNV